MATSQKQFCQGFVLSFTLASVARRKCLGWPGHTPRRRQPMTYRYRMSAVRFCQPVKQVVLVNLSVVYNMLDRRIGEIMLSVMPTKRPRMFFEVDEELKLALKSEALKAGVSVSALIESVLRREFPDALKEAAKVLQQRADKPKPRPRKD